MSSSMKTYLAEKYMSGPKADAILSRTTDKKKKKKRKLPTEATTSGWIKDDDAQIWNASEGEEERGGGGGGGDEMDPVVASDRRFKKRRKVGEAEGAGWTTLQEGYSQAALRETTPPPPEDEEPQVMGGLMTASQLQAKQSREEKATRARLAQLARETNPEEEKKSQQTIYRDSTGRAIDTLAEKALAEKKKKEREAKEIDKLQWGKGMVQKANAAETRKEMLRMKDQGFRGREDEKMNEELKGKQVWNDPAAQFLSKNKSKGPKRPEYTGAPPPPNRFGIKPGYRWDGVDRSTGFEKKFFQSRNEKRREGLESYQWGAEDM